MPELVFVMARRQNHFFVEIVDAIRDELDQLGVPSSVDYDGFPELRDDRVYVLVPPHEWFALDGYRVPPTREQLRRTVFICAEQPGTSFFTDDVRLAPLAGAVLDVNAGSIREFERDGVDGVRHFPLGWTRSWSRVEADDLEPPRAREGRWIDALHLGIYSDRRAVALASGAWALSHWRNRLILSDDHKPNFEPQANFAMADEKWDTLRRSRVLLNIHVSERPYFEWQRIVQAISNGCAVVSEHSVGYAPLEPGEHFLLGRANSLGLLAHGLLDDEEERARMAREAYLLLRTQLPLRASVETLVDAAEGIRERVARGARAEDGPMPDLVSPRGDQTAPPAGPAVEWFPSDVHDHQTSVVRRALKDIRLEILEMRRDLDAVRLGREPHVEVVGTSAAYAPARPRVSVITALYNYEHHIAPALDSIARGRYTDVELVVVDDGSTDGSQAAARRFMRERGGVPMILLAHPVNRGLGHARNTAVGFARGEFVFVLDADNIVFRDGLVRLVDSLTGDPDAAFSYGMLEMFSPDGPVGLRSMFPWQPERLRKGNFIDAMALWRMSALRTLGGYTGDKRLHGWEDYELWCRAAEAGMHGWLVPEMVARYRVTRHSMLSLTDISSTTAVSVLVERYPKLMAGVQPPL